MALSINQLKPGLTVLVNGCVYQVLEYQHVKPGKGGAFVRSKLRDLKTGIAKDITFRPQTQIQEAFIEQKRLQFLYPAGDIYHFLDLENFEEVVIAKQGLLGILKYLKDNLEINAFYHQGELMTLELPNFITFKVSETEPGLQADTVKAGTKPAVLENGLTVQVPLFVNEGDKVKIDTRRGEYVGRA